MVQNISECVNGIFSQVTIRDSIHDFGLIEKRDVRQKFCEARQGGNYVMCNNIIIRNKNLDYFARHFQFIRGFINVLDPTKNKI